LFFATVILPGCGDDAPPPQDDSGRPIKIMTLGASERGWRREYPGKIAAAQEVRLGFEVPGKIIEFPVKAGNQIKAGELIAKLDQTKFNADVADAVTKEKTAAADLERKRSLVDIGGVARKDFEAAEQLARSTKSNLENAQKALRDTELRAPFTGVVAKTLVENFDNVRAKQDVATLQDNSWMEIKIAVPESDAVLAEPGLTIEQRTARIKFSTTADPDTRTFEATLKFTPPTDVSILPGMTGHVVVTTDMLKDGSSGLRIPASAVASDDAGKSFVWVVGADMKVAKRPVSLGEMTGDQVQIKDGLATGERIALSGIHYLRDGLLVREWQSK
jgi:RND family efflux transporter MFP subunit